MKRLLILFLCLLILPKVALAVTSVYPDPKILEDMKYIDFLLDGQTCAEGRLLWNDDDKTLSVCTEDADVSLQIGQEMYVRGTNKTGSTLTNGQVVYINGAQGNRPTFALANATAENTSSKTVGLVTADIANNKIGYVTTFGLVRAVNTSMFSEGDSLWLSTTPGGITNSIPATPSHATFVGTCVTSDATAGVILVKPQNGFELYEIHDVLIASAQAHDTLVYNGTYWENEAPTYGELYFHTDDGSLDFSTDNALINVTGITNGLSNNTILNGTTGAITTSGDGFYRGQLSASFFAASAGTFDLHLGVNGVDEDKCHANRRIDTAASVGNVGITCIMSLNASDNVTFMVNSSASETIKFEALNFHIQKIH